jgi:hypothetical protein
VSELLQAVSRASKRSSAVVHQEMNAGVFSLATIASIAPWVGMLGTLFYFPTAFPAISGQREAVQAYIFEHLAEALSFSALGLSVGLIAFWSYRYLTSRLSSLGLEMESARLDVLNQLSRLPRTSGVAPAIGCPSDSRMFGEVPLDEVRRDEKFELRCLFLAGTALVLAWFAQLSRYLLAGSVSTEFLDSISLQGALFAASISVPIVFAISCLPAYLVWSKLLRRRPGGLMALGSVICLCWSVAELWLGRALP